MSYQKLRTKKMSQFNSPGQIVGLFAFATVVSVALIFLINAEAESRLDKIQVRSLATASRLVNLNNNHNPTFQIADTADTYTYNADADAEQHNYPRHIPRPSPSPSLTPSQTPTSQVFADIDTNPDRISKKVETGNFLTHFGSQIIKLFTSAGSNINLANLRKFGRGHAAVNPTSMESTDDGFPTLLKEPSSTDRARRRRSLKESESIVMDGNNNDNTDISYKHLTHGSSAGEHKTGNGRNYGVIGSTLSKPSIPAPAVTSDFHKIRHAMKKLESDGGLEGDVVLRMMLGPNAKIHESRQQQPQPHSSSIQTTAAGVNNLLQNRNFNDELSRNPLRVQPNPVPDVTFANFQERLTSLKNKNTIDWKSYTDAEEEDDDNDDDEVSDEIGPEVDEGSEIPAHDPSPTTKITWHNHIADDDKVFVKDSQDTLSSQNPTSPFAYRDRSRVRVLIPGERKHNRNYYTDGDSFKLHHVSEQHRDSESGKVSIDEPGPGPNAVTILQKTATTLDDDEDDQDQDEGVADELYDDDIILKSTIRVNSSEHKHTKKSILKENLDTICYKTDDVLVVIAITCCLNAAFVLIVWTSVKWFSISGNGAKEKQFQHLDCEDGLNDPVDFHQDRDDVFWPSSSSRTCNDRGGGRSSKKYNHYSRGNAINGRTTTSLYSFQPPDVCSSSVNTVPTQNQLRRSYSYSMEDLRFYNCG